MRRPGLTPLRAAIAFIGLFSAAVTGPFVLSAYAEHFDVVSAFRHRGSDGWHWTAEGSLAIAGMALLIAVACAFVLSSGLSVFLYTALCVLVGLASAVATYLDLRGPLDRAVWYGLPAFGVLLLWMVSRRGWRHNRSSHTQF